MSNDIRKTPLDEAVEDFAGELRTVLLETGKGGEVVTLEASLKHLQVSCQNVQEAIDTGDDDTYPGWFATDRSSPPHQD